MKAPRLARDTLENCASIDLMSDEDLKAELERLKKENQALKKTTSAGLSMKVSQKGALSIYGMGRFPVTLYKEQWLKLMELKEDILAFIEANNSELKSKSDPKKEEPKAE